VKIISIAIIMMLIFMAVSIGYAASSTVSVTAVVLSKSNCKFNSATAALNFGNLDPTTPIDRTITTSITFICHGSANPATFSITDDDGLYKTGTDANRMRHTTVITEYLPYSLTLNPTSGTVPKNTNQTLTISGTVKGTDYQNAYVGNFSDTVIISISP
jgi:spore coat protein U-like protein